MSELKTNLQEILREKQEKIIPENIKKDVTIFDITGTYEGSGSSSNGDVKLFETVEEMQADENSKEGDLAVVYRSEIQNMTVSTQTQYITFPETVTLPSAFTEDAYCRLRAVDEAAMFDGQVMLNQSGFNFNGYSETGMIRVNYQSEDGVTYTRQEFMGDSGDLTNPVDLGTSVKVYMSEEWNDNMGYFMQVGGNTFEGLYEYTKDKQISYITSNKGTKIYIPEFREIYEDGGSGSLYNGLTSEDSLLKVETVDEHNRVLTGKFLYNLNNNAYINEQKDLIAFKSSYRRYYATDISVNWEESKVYYTNRESISLPDDTVALGINLENDTILNRFDIYTSVDKTDIYQEGQEFDYDLNYQMAQNQLTAIAKNIYNAKAYSKDGVIEGTLTQTVSNQFNDTNAEVYAKIQSEYDKLEPRILTDEDKEIDKTIHTIPSKTDGTPLLNTGELTDMYSLFKSCVNLVTIPQLDTSSAVNMQSMFMGCTNLQNISDLDTSKATNMSYMFQGCANLTTIPLLDTSSATDIRSMFENCEHLMTVPDLNTSSATNMSSLFSNCASLTSIPLLDASNVTDVAYMFAACTNLVTIPQLDTSKVTNMMYMFMECTNLSDDSLNNVLAMCTNATLYTGTKTLKYMGISEEQATKCTTLSNYEMFTSAGWTTGY